MVIVPSTHDELYVSTQDRLTNVDQMTLISHSRLHNSPMLPQAVATVFLFNQSLAIDQTHP